MVKTVQVPEFFQGLVKPQSFIRNDIYHEGYDIRQGTPFGIAHVPMLLDDRNQPVFDANGNRQYQSCCEYGDHNCPKIKKFANVADALTFEQQFNLNAALYAMQSTADTYVRQHFDYNDPRFRELYGDQCQQPNFANQIFAKRELKETPNGELIFVVNGRPMPMRSAADCRQLIRNKLEHKATKQGGLDITERLWSREMASIVTYELYQHYTPKLTTSQYEAIDFYKNKNSRIINTFLNGNPIAEKDLLSVVDKILQITDAMQPCDRDLLVHRGVGNLEISPTNQGKPQLLSTSTDRASITYFVYHDVLNIQIPAGTPLLWLSQIDSNKHRRADIENEILLPPMQFHNARPQPNGDLTEWDLRSPELLDVCQLMTATLDKMPPSPTIDAARAQIATALAQRPIKSQNKTAPDLER